MSDFQVFSESEAGYSFETFLQVRLDAMKIKWKIKQIIQLQRFFRALLPLTAWGPLSLLGSPKARHWTRRRTSGMSIASSPSIHSSPFG